MLSNSVGVGDRIIRSGLINCHTSLKSKLVKIVCSVQRDKSIPPKVLIGYGSDFRQLDNVLSKKSESHFFHSADLYDSQLTNVDKGDLLRKVCINASRGL